MSVGQAPNGEDAVAPVGALIALSTFSWATMKALSRRLPTELLREVARDELAAGLRDLQVPARVIRMRVRVDDQTDGLVAGDSA